MWGFPDKHQDKKIESHPSQCFVERAGEGTGLWGTAAGAGHGWGLGERLVVNLLLLSWFKLSFGGNGSWVLQSCAGEGRSCTSPSVCPELPGGSTGSAPVSVQ